MGSEIGPTEDTVSALLELLVDPLLPSLSSLARNEAPSPAQEESVAKQVHAAVLLYNYYHRKCNQELEFLDHVSFCKLAVILKPGLLRYLESVKNAELDQNEMKLSLTDKRIRTACDISKVLETSKGADVTEWPITNVAVFLVDSSKECCILLHSSNTQGVWSVIEKEYSAEDTVDSKKKRITKKPLKENRNDETGFRQSAFAAVRDACGCSQNEVEILESHTVYSLSKVRSAVRFYIMQCKRTKEEGSYIPIRDVLDSLQGPLVTKDSCNWVTTSVVEYFHLLPYADILSAWFCREPSLEASHEAGSKKENGLQPPCDSNDEDNESKQSQKVASLPDEVIDPCKMSNTEVTEDGHSNTSSVTKVSSSEKVGTEQEISVEPFYTSVQNDLGLELENQSKEIIDPCKMSKTEVTEDGHSNTSSVTKASSSEKVGTEQEISVEPFYTSVQNDDEGLELENQSKEVPQRTLRSCSRTGTKPNTSDKDGLEKEAPVNTSVQKDVGLVIGNQIKVSPSRVLRSGVKSEKMKGADTKAELVETIVYSKKRKTSKKGVVGDDTGCKLSKADPIAKCLVQSLSTNMDIDEPISSIDCSTDDKNKSCCSEDRNPIELKAIVLSQNCPPSPITDIVTKEEIVSALQITYEHNGEKNNAQVKAATSYHNGMQEEIVSTLPSTSEKNGEHKNARDKAIFPSQDGGQGLQANALVPYGSDLEKLEKTHKVISSRENLLSETALKVLYRKRDMLYYQQRSIGDEIALCNRNIEEILNGSEDLGVKLDTIIEACNFETLSGGVSDQGRSGRMYQHSQNQNTPNYLKRKRLSEANLISPNSCQQLDDICHENCWVIPTYNISISDGQFLADVTVKGVEFEFLSTGVTCNTPLEARESAASSALIKLRNMASAS